MRQFLLPAAPAADGSIVIGGSDFRYLASVLRLERDDLIEGRLPDGSLRAFRVDSVDRRSRTVALSLSDASVDLSGVPPLSVPPEGFPVIVLFQWQLKGPKMDLVIRQATEAGVSAIVPVSGERCVAGAASGDARGDRRSRIVREARQQSGSPIATELLEPVSPLDVPRVWASLQSGPDAKAIVLTEAPLARKTLHRYLESGAGSVALAVGPEGGMTAREIEGLVEAGFECVHFATNVLRAETCALYAIAAVQNALMEIESWQSKE